ncbi:unnamed protein product [Medioppia subpectinata]|uniref:TEP1-F n=1 Tax=Medioppia subpectinata TaxID=1979941 RepID=A0A7R9KHQ6_9ACAR|nr:unnamed protein product [Medioppia subpectinata]CAG2103592.1 unnamed protein product [Medioppia subpectinata]
MTERDCDGRAKPTYTVVAPKTLRPNADYRVSVSLYDIPAPIQVNVSVVGPDNNTATTGAVVFAESETQMLSLPIGDWTDGAYKLIVTGAGAKFTKLKPPPELPYGGGYPIVVTDANTTTTTTTPAPDIVTDGFRDEVSLQFQPKTVSVFIQTDKAMYKPGQKVQFRALVVTPSLLPVNNASVDIHIKDGNGNRVKQWTGLTPIRGVVSQELQLSEQPVLGEWAIVVELSGVKHQKAFSVAEYVLPTFDVEVVLPKYTTRDRPDIVATVKALYTYGQGVKGDLTLTVQTKEHYSRSKYRTRYPIDGSVDIPINLMDDLSLDQHFQNMEIEVIAVVKEALTGRSYNRSNTMKIYDRDVKVEQVKTSQTFKPGLKYPVLIKVTDQDDKPVPENGPKLTLKYGYTYEDRDQKTVLMSPVNGLIAVDLYPPNNTEHINLRAEYMGKDYWLENIQKAQSPSGNYIQVVRLDSDKDVSVGQQLRFAVNATEPIGRLVCEVLGKGDIVWAQSIDIPDNKMTHEFGLEATLAMAPTARLVCHYLRAANQEVVADGLKFDVSGTLRTPVSVTTDVQTTKPGAPVEVRVSTKPDAYVGLLGVDQSVLLLKSGYDITREDVDKELKTYDSTGADDQHRYGWWQNSVTAGEIFDNSGVVVMSNGLIHRQRAYGRITVGPIRQASASKCSSMCHSIQAPVQPSRHTTAGESPAKLSRNLDLEFRCFAVYIL